MKLHFRCKEAGQIKSLYLCFLNAFVYTFKKTVSMFKQMIITIGMLFTGGVRLNQLAGPVGIYSVVGAQRTAGLANILYLMAFLSVNVGFINLLPIPAFDGGHILKQYPLLLPLSFQASSFIPFSVYHCLY